MIADTFEKDILAEFGENGFFYEARKFNFDRKLHDRTVSKLRELDLSKCDWSQKRTIGKVVWGLPAIYMRYERRNVECGISPEEYENAWLELKREVERIMDIVFG